jgi:hypothetical protein
MRHRYQAAAVRCGNKACVSSRSAAGVGCSRNEHAITFAHAKIACRQNVRSLERMHQQHPDRPTADALDRNEVRDQRLVVHRVGITPSIALCAIAWMVAAQKPQARSCPGSKAAIRAAAGNIDPARSLRRSIIASPAFRGQSLVCDRPLMVIIGTSLSLSTMPACPFGRSSTLRLSSWYRKAAIQS